MSENKRIKPENTDPTKDAKEHPNGPGLWEMIYGEESHEESPKLNEQDMYDTVAENMENVTDYIEKLTTKIQNY